MLQELEKVVSCWRHCVGLISCIRFGTLCAAALTAPFLISRSCSRDADAGEATSVRMTQSACHRSDLGVETWGLGARSSAGWIWNKGCNSSIGSLIEGRRRL